MSEEQAKEANESFRAGFAKISGETPEEIVEEIVDETEEAVEEPVPDEWAGVPDTVRQRIENLSSSLEGRLHKVESRVGRINSTVEQKFAEAANSAADKKGTASPSQEELDAALSDEKKWEGLKEQYGEWVDDFEKIITAQEKRFNSKIPTDYVSKKDFTQIFEREVEERLDRRDLSRAHPNWDEDVNTVAFQDWLFNGGPDKSKWGEFQEADKSDPAQAERMLNDWIRTHPNWWAEKGSRFLSEKITDQIAILDEYKNAAKAATTSSADSRQEKNNQRLRAATTPKTTGQAPQTGISDEQAFNRGFNRIRKAASS